MRVAVYWNLHRKAFSVKALEGPHRGRVIDRRERVDLTDVTFQVSEAGRQRTLREGHKNVHAYAAGRLAPDNMDLQGGWTAVTYNPRRAPTFTAIETGQPVRTAARVRLHRDGDRASIIAERVT